MARRGRSPYAALLKYPELLDMLAGLAGKRGVVVNRSKDGIGDSFRRPIFPGNNEDFRRVLLSQVSTTGFPGIHLTHAEYDAPPVVFGDFGGSRAFHFFLDVDGRGSLEPAKGVVSAMSRSLEDLGVPHWLKFSGRSGFHLHVPAKALPLNPVARNLSLDIKHYLVRRAKEICPSDLAAATIHPKRYYPTTQGIQRLPFSMHEESGLLALPLHREDLRDFRPKKAMAGRFRVGDAIDAMTPARGSADELLACLAEEQGRPVPAYHRR